MKEIERILKKLQRTNAMLLIMVLVLGCLPVTALATASKTEIPGTIYEFDKGSHYEFHDSEKVVSQSSNTYGTFSITGNTSVASEKDGVPAFEVSDGKLTFFYSCDDLLTSDLDSWHMVDDKSKKVAEMKLDEDILKGAIILQVSKDRMNWSNTHTITNAFADTTNLKNGIYEATNVQLINGCFYRVIVVYELEKRVKDSNILFINTDKYEKKKCAEVYEFFAAMGDSKKDEVDPNRMHRIGDRNRVKEHDGYFGEEPIGDKDIHYKWKIGDFYVGGFTGKEEDKNGNMVFLKNVGDQITLWFNLAQNIDAINGNENLSITADKEGHDQYFETGTMDFGRGTVIIRQTDQNNKQNDLIIYTNYLEANATVGADTKVHLFEEGDYEVALDYEVTSDELIDKIGHYRIFFKFSVRNGNCMFYPRDLATGSELSNRDVTENGFRLDLAGSRYLKVTIKREVLKDSADGLVEDTRFNEVATDGSEYTDEGIYTITVRNVYTNAETTKRIYVGSNTVLKAHMVTGRSIADINALLDQGATIAEDGTIQLAVVAPQTPAEPDSSTEPPVVAPENTQDQQEPVTEPEGQNSGLPIVPILGGAAVCVIAVIIALTKKRGTKQAVNDNLDEGGTEQ